ncbi:DUF3828 domain-containing protein [Methylobacterium sp. BTF04]|uniref:DUF3828 domain-containing protein n=1 Tax=Methylobacterium sp. BTF04 TaxID=2708300 RepID=UPI0013D6A3B7|nr:DUF3828 domain-containing protein [Methylobacterium sp. BTF04]NEU12031.1 DUF3828 domain-containing protein [Methylobacterium sp. BTF04]
MSAFRQRLMLGIALLLACAASPALAQSATDPAETVRELYAADDITVWRFHARSLRALFEKDRKDAQGEMGRLDFAYHVNGQDTEDDWAKTLTVTTLANDETRAEVQARFRNFSAQDIRYDLVKENGRWLVEDVRALTKARWRLSTILKGEAR